VAKKILVALAVLLIFTTSIAFAQKRIKISYISGKWPMTVAMDALMTKIAKEEGFDFETFWYTFDDQRNKLILDFKGGSTEWDIIFVDTKWTEEFASLGLLIPIEDFVKSNAVSEAELDLKGYIDFALKSQQYNGIQYCLPVHNNINLVVYRKDLFESKIEKENFKKKYGYELRAPDTYSQFMDLAQFFTRQKGELLDGKPLDSEFYGTVHSNKRGGFLYHDYIPYVEAFGADIIYDRKTMRPTWNSPESMAAAKYYKELAKYQPSGHINMTSGEATSLFANGHIAMQIEFMDRLMEMVEDPKTSKVIGKVGYTVLPTQVPYRPHASGSFLCGAGIYSKSQHKNEAIKLLAKVLSTEGQTWMAKNFGGFIPSRSAILSDPELAKQKTVLRGIMDMVYNRKDKIHIFTHPLFPQYPRCVEIAEDSISEMLAGTKGVEQAINEAQGKLEALFKEAGYLK
jgi:multiple sugar transport system substrate-binding protein